MIDMLFIEIGSPPKWREKAVGWSRRACCSMQQGPPPAWPGRAVVELGRRSWEGPKPIAILGSTGSIGTQVWGNDKLRAFICSLREIDMCVKLM